MSTYSVKTETAALLSLDELRVALRKVGDERYHHRHRFHLLMHDGKLTRGQLQAWALNRYCYQNVIPVKDAIILSRSDDPEFRRAWRKRIVDHDGDGQTKGGIEKWLKLAEATGLDADRVASQQEILPATRYAVNEYLNLVRTRSLLEAVASSLTELFSRDLIALRMDRMASIIRGSQVDSRTSKRGWIRLPKMRPSLCSLSTITRKHVPSRNG